jgi:hypothetical protein
MLVSVRLASYCNVDFPVFTVTIAREMRFCGVKFEGRQACALNGE